MCVVLLCVLLFLCRGLVVCAGCAVDCVFYVRSLACESALLYVCSCSFVVVCLVLCVVLPRVMCFVCVVFWCACVC